MSITKPVCRALCAWVLLCYALSVCAAPSAAHEHVPGEVLVGFRRAPATLAETERREALRERFSARMMARTPASRVERWALASATADCVTVAEAIARRPEVAFAEPNYIYHATRVPDDPRFGELWGFENTGQENGTLDADIDVTEAWELTTGGEIIVGIVDTGIDYTHSDLVSNMWRNPGETPGDGIDNDGNGHVDDVFGIDTYNGDADPLDDESHGTHCAGTVAARGNNGIGVAGVCWRARLMALKFLGENGSGNSFDAATCIEYAVRNGARVLNNSWGGGAYSSTLLNAIEFARTSNVLFCAAAGNGGADRIGDDNDADPHYPSSYTNENVIAVAASDHNDVLTVFSNYGDESVDMAAPGYQILSSVPGDDYEKSNGTSMATPHVTGAAALLLSYNQFIGVSELRAALLGNVDVVPSLTGRVASSGRLNVYGALQALDGLFFDRVEYFVNTQAHVLAVASAMAASNSLGVSITTDQGDIESLELGLRDPGGYAFTGSLDIVYGPAIPGNGRLEARHGAALSVTHPGIAATGLASVVLGLKTYITTKEQTVPYATSRIAVEGVNNGTVVCGMTVSNAATGAALDFPATNRWTAPEIDLASDRGENPLHIFGTNSFGFAATDTVVISRYTPAGQTNFVAPASGTHAWPYTTWATAATDIYAAVHTAPDGNVVRVAPGRYAGATLVLDRAVVLESANGPQSTILDGQGVGRCLEVTTSAVVRGFTLINGTNRYGGGAFLLDGALHDCVAMSNRVSYYGAGICIYPSARPGTLVSNCLAIHNHAGEHGGGIAVSINGTAHACVMTANSADEDGGGGYANRGGGFVRCVVSNNVAGNNGGGIAFDMFRASNGFARSCLVVGNVAAKFGGGVDLDYAGEIEGSTIVSNACINLAGGGVHTYRGGVVRNSIIYGNSAPVGNNDFNQYSGWLYSHTCITPDPGGTSNVAAAPVFVDFAGGDFSLHGSSPCIDRGDSSGVPDTWDMAGAPRVSGAGIDIGAFEFSPGALQCAFSAQPTAALLDTDITFTPALWGTNTTGVVCAWDVDGDGTAEYAGLDTQTVTHAYLTEGVYTVTLTVTNTCGEAAQFTRADYLHVVPEPIGASVLLGILGVLACAHRRARAGLSLHVKIRYTTSSVHINSLPPLD